MKEHNQPPTKQTDIAESSRSLRERSFEHESDAMNMSSNGNGGGAVPRFFPCATYETKTVSSPLVAKN